MQFFVGSETKRHTRTPDTEKRKRLRRLVMARQTVEKRPIGTVLITWGIRIFLLLAVIGVVMHEVAMNDYDFTAHPPSNWKAAFNACEEGFKRIGSQCVVEPIDAEKRSFFEKIRSMENFMKRQLVYDFTGEGTGTLSPTDIEYYLNTNNTEQFKKVYERFNTDNFLKHNYQVTNGVIRITTNIEPFFYVKYVRCGLNWYKTNFNPEEPKYFPLYIALGLVIIYILWEQSKTRMQKTADKIYNLLAEDLANGKFRNGIRVDDIYLHYSVVISGNRDVFYTQVLPLMSKRLENPNSKIKKTLNRHGMLVWKLKA